MLGAEESPKSTKVYAKIFYSALRTGGKKISRPCRRSKRGLLDAIDALSVDCRNNCDGTTFLSKKTEHSGGWGKELSRLVLALLPVIPVN